MWSCHTPIPPIHRLFMLCLWYCEWPRSAMHLKLNDTRSLSTWKVTKVILSQCWINFGPLWNCQCGPGLPRRNCRPWGTDPLGYLIAPGMSVQMHHLHPFTKNWCFLALKWTSLWTIMEMCSLTTFHKAYYDNTVFVCRSPKATTFSYYNLI